MLECSYADQDSKHTVYGHLDTKLMQREMEHLAENVGDSFSGLNVIVTIVKRSWGMSI